MGGACRRKKRLTALADWHFQRGGGPSYCGGCGQACPECPYTVNRPQTVQGLQVWDLVVRMQRQLRVSMGGIVGFDMTTAFAMADALGIDAVVVAEILPAVEAVAMMRMNEAGED